MIKSTSTTLKFSNHDKLVGLQEFIREYRRVVGCYIDILWRIDDVKRLIPKEIQSKIDSWLSARALQCAGKQASSIVRGTRAIQKRREYVAEKLKSEGFIEKAEKLQSVIDSVKISKPAINEISPELDSRFVDIDLDNATSFDGWLTLSSLGNRLKLTLPFKKTRHFNKMLASGIIYLSLKYEKLLKNCVKYMHYFLYSPL